MDIFGIAFSVFELRYATKPKPDVLCAHVGGVISIIISPMTGFLMGEI